MKFLSAPWRWSFISKLTGREKDCIFCRALQEEGFDSLVCYRGEKFFVILNKYPYSTGHVMVVPYKHVNSPDQIPARDTVEMWELMNRSLKVLRQSFHPQGFNMGMNLGRPAGAGIKDHFHLHIVPRWEGDANFMAVTGSTKVLSYDLEYVYDTLCKGFKQLAEVDNGED